LKFCLSNQLAAAKYIQNSNNTENVRPLKPKQP